MEYLSMIIVGLILGSMLGWNLHYVRMRYKRPNKVRFYLTRDKDRKIYLWIGKPLRFIYTWNGFNSWAISADIQDLICMGISVRTISSLKWEDEPIEVFLNLED